MTQLEYILTRCPQRFGGKDNWLGFKMSPHKPMTFINEVTVEGVKTDTGFKEWSNVDQPTIQTIYQRLKVMELNEKL